MSVKSSLNLVQVDVEPALKSGAYIKMNVPETENGYCGHFRIEDVESLITELAAAIGREVKLTEPKATLPTELGIYVSADMGTSGRLESAQIYKLKESGWTNADGEVVDIERVERMANLTGGLVRLTPEGE